MGLIIAAGFASVLALGAFVVLLVKAKNRGAVALAFVIMLPLQPLAFLLVRLPIDGLLRATFGIVTWVAIVQLFYAPLTEEPAKWIAAALPPVRRAIMVEPVTVALAVGLGFAIGEIWFLANSLLALPGLASIPVWEFGPFVFERLEVCFLHGAFVAPPFVALARGRSFWLGGLIGMALHFLLNFPIFLKEIDLFGLGRTWFLLLLLWVILLVVAMAVMVRRLSRPPVAAPAVAPGAGGTAP